MWWRQDLTHVLHNGLLCDFVGARQTVELLGIWDAMTPMWRHGNITHTISTWFNLICCDLIMITNVYVLWNHIYMHLGLLSWCCDKRMFAHGDIVIISLQWSHNQRDGVSNHRCLVWLPSRVFFQAQIKENIKGPRHWPMWRKFTGDRWNPRTKGQ